MRRPGARRTPPARERRKQNRRPRSAVARWSHLHTLGPCALLPFTAHLYTLTTHRGAGHSLHTALRFHSLSPAMSLLSKGRRHSSSRWRFVGQRGVGTVRSALFARVGGARAPQGSHPSDSSSRSPTAHAIPCKQSASGPQHGRHNGQSSTMRAAHCTPHLVGRDNHSPCRRPPCPRRGNASGRGMR